MGSPMDKRCVSGRAQKGARRLAQAWRRLGSGGWRLRVARPVGWPFQGRSNEPTQNAPTSGLVGRYQAKLPKTFCKAGLSAAGYAVAAAAVAGNSTVAVLMSPAGLGSRDWQRALLVMPSVCLARLRMHRLRGINMQRASSRHRRAHGPKGHSGGDQKGQYSARMRHG